MTFEVKLMVDCRCILGEGIVWHASSPVFAENGFFFVDIHGRHLHFFDVDGQLFCTWDIQERIGWILPAASGEYLVAGLQSGVARLWLQPTVRLEWVSRFLEQFPSLRLNDGKTDCSGAIWTGSLNNDDESRVDGKLFRVAPDTTVTVMDEGYTVTNGPAISPDGKLMLHTDSGRRTVYAFDLDVGAGHLSNKRIWRVFSETDGYPDGMCFDADGAVWIAHWGVGRVSRFAIDGALLQQVRLPVSNVTNLAFGGPGLDRLFVTTASVGLDDGAHAREPLAGGVFEIVGHGVRGLQVSLAHV